MSSSRTRNVSINIGVAFICQVINLALNFISRTVFVKYLGVEYLGVNGLFTDILLILSFAELGIGNAIVFSMYKPLAEQDESKLCSLLALYKKAYKIIFFIVIVFGLIIVPFLPIIIKEQPSIDESLVIIYLLFLLNSALSYTYVYKKSIIIADQKNFIVLSITEVTHIIQIVLQIFMLYLHSYYGFLISQIVFTLAGNIICSRYANKHYSYINKTAQPLVESERKDIFRNVGAMALYKLGSVVLGGTSSVILSSTINVAIVGVVSNYVLLSNACNSILMKIADAFTASVGNLGVTADSEKKYDVFKKILLITVWLFGLAAVGLWVISNSLIEIWLGKDYLLDNFAVFAVVLGFYIQGIHSAEVTFRITLGYFVKGKWAPLGSSVLNVLLAFVLGYYWGAAGVLLAVPLARMLCIGVVDTLLLYKNAFHQHPIKYYIDNLKFFILMVVISLICSYLIKVVSIGGIWGLFVQGIIVLFVYNGVMFICFARTKELKGIVEMAKSLIKNKI